MPATAAGSPAFKAGLSSSTVVRHFSLTGAPLGDFNIVGELPGSVQKTLVTIKADMEKLCSQLQKQLTQKRHRGRRR